MITDYMRPPRLPGSLSLQNVFIALLDYIREYHLSGKFIGNLHLYSFRIKEKMIDNKRKLSINFSSLSSNHDYLTKAFEPL